MPCGEMPHCSMRKDGGVAIKLALAGDTTSDVASRSTGHVLARLAVRPEVVEIANEADLFART